MLLRLPPLCAPRRRLADLGLARFFVLVEVGVGMGIGKASVYKYIPDYFPNDVGAVGGLVGTLGALGGFFCRSASATSRAATGRPESCFWLMTALVAVCLVWLHAVVRNMPGRSAAGRHRQRREPRPWDTRGCACADAGSRAGAAARPVGEALERGDGNGRCSWS